MAEVYYLIQFMLFFFFAFYCIQFYFYFVLFWLVHFHFVSSSLQLRHFFLILYDFWILFCNLVSLDYLQYGLCLQISSFFSVYLFFYIFAFVFLYPSHLILSGFAKFFIRFIFLLFFLRTLLLSSMPLLALYPFFSIISVSKRFNKWAWMSDSQLIRRFFY